jgi:hypothetical protein
MGRAPRVINDEINCFCVASAFDRLLYTACIEFRGLLLLLLLLLLLEPRF